jgi:hypothetical protein
VIFRGVCADHLHALVLHTPHVLLLPDPSRCLWRLCLSLPCRPRDFDLRPRDPLSLESDDEYDKDRDDLLLLESEYDENDDSLEEESDGEGWLSRFRRRSIERRS